MTDTQIQDIYARLDSLTSEVNSLKLLTGAIGTSQVAIAQIYDRLDTFAETTSNNFAQVTGRFDRIEGRLERIENSQLRHSNQLDNLQVNVDEILRILRDRNGGSGL